MIGKITIDYGNSHVYVFDETSLLMRVRPNVEGSDGLFIPFDELPDDIYEVISHMQDDLDGAINGSGS